MPASVKSLAEISLCLWRNSVAQSPHRVVIRHFDKVFVPPWQGVTPVDGQLHFSAAEVRVLMVARRIRATKKRSRGWSKMGR